MSYKLEADGTLKLSDRFSLSVIAGSKRETWATEKSHGSYLVPKIDFNFKNLSDSEKYYDIMLEYFADEAKTKVSDKWNVMSLSIRPGQSTTKEVVVHDLKGDIKGVSLVKIIEVDNTSKRAVEVFNMDVDIVIRKKPVPASGSAKLMKFITFAAIAAGIGYVLIKASTT